jgi:hypothetical protein
MKITILKFLISKKGFFDREKLVSLSEQSFLKICKNYYNSKVCKIYRKFLRIGKPKIQKIVLTSPEIIYQRAINEIYSQISFFHKVKNKIKRI